MFGIRLRAHGPAGGAPVAGGTVMPAAGFIPGTDIGPALVPIPAVFAAAWQSNGQIHGAAGTQPVPAPGPLPGYDQNTVRLANVGYIGAGGAAVQHWRPQLWYETDIPATIAVQTINQTHELPVPAVRPQNVMVVRATNSPGGIAPGDGAFAARLGGRWPIGWPRVVVSFPETGGLGARDYG